LNTHLDPFRLDGSITENAKAFSRGLEELNNLINFI